MFRMEYKATIFIEHELYTSKTVGETVCIIPCFKQQCATMLSHDLATLHVN